MRTKLFKTSNLTCLWTDPSSYTFAFFLPTGDYFIAARRDGGICRIETVTGTIAETVDSRIKIDVFSSVNSDGTLILAPNDMWYQIDYRYVVE